ncbi:MAG: hypothetical protein NZ772_18625 [Cyanobacteria bacterium]|nr:hypothetical protein [Cyanobacteriota bacterium]
MRAREAWFRLPHKNAPLNPPYRICNWSEDNAGLEQQGSLTGWIDELVLENWLVLDLSGKPGASPY